MGAWAQQWQRSLQWGAQGGRWGWTLLKWGALGGLFFASDALSQLAEFHKARDFYLAARREAPSPQPQPQPQQFVPHLQMLEVLRKGRCGLEWDWERSVTYSLWGVALFYPAWRAWFRLTERFAGSGLVLPHLTRAAMATGVGGPVIMFASAVLFRYLYQVRDAYKHNQEHGWIADTPPNGSPTSLVGGGGVRDVFSVLTRATTYWTHPDVREQMRVWMRRQEWVPRLYDDWYVQFFLHFSHYCLISTLSWRTPVWTLLYTAYSPFANRIRLNPELALMKKQDLVRQIENGLAEQEAAEKSATTTTTKTTITTTSSYPPPSAAPAASNV